MRFIVRTQDCMGILSGDSVWAEEDRHGYYSIMIASHIEGKRVAGGLTDADAIEIIDELQFANGRIVDLRQWQ